MDDQGEGPSVSGSTGGDRSSLWELSLEEPPEKSFESVDGLDQEISRLRESFVEPAVRDPQECFGATGVLIYGAPGVGKTHLTTALLGEFGFEYLQVTPADLPLEDPDLCSILIEEIVLKARQHAPSVLLFEGFDVIAPSEGSDDWGRPTQVATELGASLDEIDTASENVRVIATTRRISDIERGLRRPGRFDILVGLEDPGRDRRRQILSTEVSALLTQTDSMSVDREDIDPQLLVDLSNGFSAADIVAAVERAGQIAVADDHTGNPTITQSTLRAAFEEVAEQKGKLEQAEDDVDDNDLPPGLGGSGDELEFSQDWTPFDDDSDSKPSDSNTSGDHGSKADPDDADDGDLFDASSDDENVKENGSSSGFDPADDSDVERGTILDGNEVPDVTYDDIGGLEAAKQRLREVIEWPRKYPDRFEMLDIDPATGILLHGPPGTGKTMLAKAVANETDSTFILINGPEILDKYFGESEHFVRDIFETAEEQAPSIIFFDEFDSIAAQRSGYKVNSELTDSIVNQLLSALDGMANLEDVVVIAATNRVDIIDPALRRPGRFGIQIEVSNPDTVGRREIFRVHTADRRLADDVDPAWLASRTDRQYSGADIAAVCEEAAMAALRETVDSESEPNEEPTITRDHFKQALETVDPTTDEVGTSGDLDHSKSFR